MPRSINAASVRQPKEPFDASPRMSGTVNAAMEKITLQGIHKAYLTSSGRTVALQDVNLKVANDEFVALVARRAVESQLCCKSLAH